MDVDNLLSVGIKNVLAGERVKIIQPSNLYECELADDVFVGPFCEIQSGVRIGARTKIQSHSFVCSFLEIGEDCFVGHGVMFVNDKFSGGGPAQGDKDKWLRTVVGNRVSIGSNCTVLPISICDDVVLGAGAVVTQDIREPGAYVGNPARMLRK